MRFLQTEWHRHERDRNAWEIERAEMKAKIARHEGDNRTGKKMQESLSRHIQMLEAALKNERNKLKATVPEKSAVEGDKGESVRETTALAIKGRLIRIIIMFCNKDSLNVLNSLLGKPRDTALEAAAEDPAQLRRDGGRQQSHGYLEKSIQEITYLLTPPANPPPQPTQLNPQEYANVHGFAAPSNQPQSLKEAYMQQRIQENQQAGMQFAQPSPSPNHQPPPVPSMSETTSVQHQMNQQHHSSQMARNVYDEDSVPSGFPLDLPKGMGSSQSHPASSFPLPSDDSVEKVTHSYDSFGKPILTRQDDGSNGARNPEIQGNIDPDGWDFEDAPRAPAPEPETLPQRPDTDLFPNANHIAAKSPSRLSPGGHRRKGSMSRRRSDGSHEVRDTGLVKADSAHFKVRFALRGHLDVVRSVIFTGGGSPSEPEICTTGDDGLIKRWIIPASYQNFGSHGPTNSNDLDIQSYFTHRGHDGIVTCLAACPSSSSFSSGGRALGDGWIFSGGEDATVRVWERGRVDSKATMDGHSDCVWAICVLPGTCGSVFGSEAHRYGGPERVLLASGSADGTVKIWSVSAPPQLSSPQSGSRRGVGGSRRHSVSSGSGFPSSPQPSTATPTPFKHTLVHTISRPNHDASPTCIAPLSATGGTFVVSYTDASVVVFDTRTSEEVVGMASLETYDNTSSTGVNSVVATTVGLDGSLSLDAGRGVSEDESVIHGPTGSSGGVEGTIISGHEDSYIRFFDANSGMKFLFPSVYHLI